MIGDGDPERDLAALVVRQAGRLVATGNRYEPNQLLDPDGARVVAVTAYFQDLLAAGRSESTVRSYLTSADGGHADRRISALTSENG